MISDPYFYIDDFVKAGADIITFHIECDSDINKTIDKIIALGCKASLAVKPNTDIEAVYPYLDKLSMVLVMTVEPGFGGQSFMENTMPKIEKLRAKCPELDIQVDGGINPETVKSQVRQAQMLWLPVLPYLTAKIQKKLSNFLSKMRKHKMAVVLIYEEKAFL